ncbi:MAG: hypothetical protein WCI62_04490 [Erysipelotrichaceae bacterium]
MKTGLKIAVLLGAAAATAYVVKKIKQSKSEEIPPIQASDLSPVYPTDKQSTTLPQSLLNSFKVQCKVMLDVYQKDAKIKIVHFIELSDGQKTASFSDKLKDLPYTVTTKKGSMLELRQDIIADAQIAYDEIVKIAQICNDHQALYKGWIFEE